MMYKQIDLNYLILCFDRLTRFKFTYDKYYRVFLDILNKYYLGDKKNLSLDNIISIVVEIFNNSVKSCLNSDKNDGFLNNFIKQEEERCFYQNNESRMFLKADLNFGGLIDLISNEENLPLNLKALVELNKNKNKSPLELREANVLKFPIEKIVLSEGATEEILLGEFALGFGYNFSKHGVQLIGAGGKNQVARKYYKIINEVKLPIFVLLDKDAQETKELILPKLRSCDKIYLIQNGEFEDIIPYDIIIKSINTSHKNNFLITKNDFAPSISMTKNLKEIYRIKGFGNFNKADFAKDVRDFIRTDFGITDEMSHIIEEIKQL